MRSLQINKNLLSKMSCVLLLKKNMKAKCSHAIQIPKKRNVNSYSRLKARLDTSISPTIYVVLPFKEIESVGPIP